MKNRISSFFCKIISTTKNHWFLSIIISGLIGAILSWIVGWILPTRSVYASNIPQKELTCTIDFSYRMITRRVADSKLQVFYDGQEVKSPYIYSITIKNTGDYSISNEDFKESFSVFFSGCDHIVQARVSKCSNESIIEEITAKSSINENKLIINDFYLNTGEYFTVYIISEGVADTIIYNSRISDLSSLTLRNTPKETRDKKLRPFILLFAAAIIANLVFIIFTINSSKKATKRMETYRIKIEEELLSDKCNDLTTSFRE